jgi:hypothetical protein
MVAASMRRTEVWPHSKFPAATKHRQSGPQDHAGRTGATPARLLSARDNPVYRSRRVLRDSRLWTRHSVCRASHSNSL